LEEGSHFGTAEGDAGERSSLVVAVVTDMEMVRMKETDILVTAAACMIWAVFG
jgi:hypothetical protein